MLISTMNKYMIIIYWNEYYTAKLLNDKNLLFIVIGPWLALCCEIILDTISMIWPWMFIEISGLRYIGFVSFYYFYVINIPLDFFMSRLFVWENDE